MNRFIYILFFAFIIASCGTSKDGIIKTDAPVSSADYPYIDAFHKGMQFKVQGRTEDAILEFEKCLSIRKDDDAVYYALSKLELERGNSVQSAQYIIKANEIDPENTWYMEELAYMYYETQDFENAVKQFQRLVEIEPRNIDWMYGLSEALIKSGKDAQAIEVFNKMEAQVGKHPHFPLQRYAILMKLGKVSEAETELLDAKEEFPEDPSIIGTLVDHYYRQNQTDKAEKFLEELVAADPSNGRAHLALADVYQRRNEMDRAFEALHMAFKSSNLDIDTKMNVLINIQQQSVTIPDEAYPILETFVEMYPDSAKTHSIKGDYLLQSGDDERALKSYRKAVQLDASLYPIWNQVLIMEYQSEDFETLYEDSKACLELFPTMVSVYLLNGISANRIEKYEAAQESLSVGAELIVNDQPMEAEFYGQLAEADFGMKEYDAMITHYKKAIMLDGHSPLLKNNFARRLATIKKELDLAASLAEQITDIASDDDVFLDTRGWVYFQKGDYKEAQKYLVKAIGNNPNNSSALEHMGDVYFMQNNTKDALDFWKEAKEKGGGSILLDKKINDKKYYAPEL